MTIMTGLMIAIKDNGFLALISIAAPIYVSDIPMCRKVLLQHTKTRLLYRSITPSHFWSLIIPECLLMQVSTSKCKFSISKVTTDSVTRVKNGLIDNNSRN